MPEKTKIWLEIRRAAHLLNKEGMNTIELLLWSQDKNLVEVRTRLQELETEIAKKKKERELLRKREMV